ncbi:CYTH domain-containing protein [Thiohalorhabdus methylotrophus]|uniref:CYTH domain-containing protein n=1 Tax=Thiohalorhabdus methylotrophus TaxID=3242694 RepID=A0ABV4TTY3_9GAMM
MLEQEFKLQVTHQERFEEIAGAPEVRSLSEGPERTIEMTADYIDTAGLHLLQAGYAYRVRREGSRWVATVKADAGENAGDGLHHHREWEAHVDTPEPDLGVFADAELIQRLRALQGDLPLITLFRVDMVRRARDLRLEGGTTAEWAADRGTIVADGREDPICEVELELKDGYLGALQELINTLQSKYPLEPGARTKFSRGLALAGLGQSTNE